MLNGVLISLSIDPFDTRQRFLTSKKQVIDRSFGKPIPIDMAAAIQDTFIDVYKTAAAEFGFGTSKNIKRPNLPPGINNDDLVVDRNGAKAPQNIWEACKLGRIDSIQDFVLKEGIEVLGNHDSAGHTPAHWACLTGRVDVLSYICQQGPFYNICSTHELGQYPIHWASINGHVNCADVLLQHDVPIDIRDAKGSTPLVVAAQYGQTVICGFFMGKGAKLSITDNENDTALHWAAFKGQPDLVRLLVYSGFNPHQKDNFGQTPLHLACISGNLNIVRDLCQIDKVEINVLDRNGKTPLMLAAGRRHDDVERFLKGEIRARSSLLGASFKLSHLIFGPPGKTRVPMLFFAFNVIFWGYPMYAFRAVPLTFHLYPTIHYAFIACNLFMWFCLYHCNMTDPGFLPRNIPEYDQIIRKSGQLMEPVTGTFSEHPLARLCHTCRTVKPVRAKHCKVCDRCVKEMDHHCPYIYNCVGLHNRHTFFLFINFTLASGILSVTLFLLVWDIEGRPRKADYIIGAILQTCFGILLILINRYVWYHAAVNITTNESMNYKRYKYLQDSKGNFHNPFNRGYFTNCLEFFHFKESFVEAETKKEGNSFQV